MPQNLQSELDRPFWAGFLDATSDLYWGLNLDKFYWSNNKTIINKTLEIFFSAILDYINDQPSWVLAAMYKMEKPQLIE